MTKFGMVPAGVRRLDDRFEVRLPVHERQVLADLPDGLRAIVAGQARPELRERLFPPASDDPEIDEEYQALIGEDLQRARLAAVDEFVATLNQGEARRGMWVVQLDQDQAHAWLSTVNDLRLVLASLAGVTSESAWETGPDQQSAESVLLYHLSWLQEEFLAALMAGLPDDDDS